jgi:hypothetical protein
MVSLQRLRTRCSRTTPDGAERRVPEWPPARLIPLLSCGFSEGPDGLGRSPWGFESHLLRHSYQRFHSASRRLVRAPIHMR